MASPFLISPGKFGLVDCQQWTQDHVYLKLPNISETGGESRSRCGTRLCLMSLVFIFSEFQKALCSSFHRRCTPQNEWSLMFSLSSYSVDRYKSNKPSWHIITYHKCEWVKVERECLSVLCKGEENTKAEVSAEQWIFTHTAAVPPAPLQPSTNPHRLFFFPLCNPQEAKQCSKRFSFIGSERVQCSITCSRDLRCCPNQTRSHPAS